ncbi:bll1368 protein [Vibrio ishigakensis]|uniref:Bll1368 protein n=1 Tax=Vibrio ishigakensis TaxID=1481914 RepID=A0A0B8P4Q6_9VIBR|nr:bll1368 protein [Vibrio ishigakensis]
MTEIDGVVNKGLGKVVKTTLDGKVLHTFKNPFELGLYEQGLTYNPTETCVASNGDIYIADGYGASYVHCFDQEGTYKHTFGGFSELDSSLLNPHGIAIDSRSGTERLVVSSRKQSRFKFYSLDGEYIEAIHLPGAYPCRPVIKGDYLYAGVCWSGPIVSDVDLENYLERDDNSGFVLILDKQGKVAEALGAEATLYDNGVLTPLCVSEDSPFHHVHDVLVLEDNKLIISQWRAEQTLPFSLVYTNNKIKECDLSNA